MIIIESQEGVYIEVFSDVTCQAQSNPSWCPTTKSLGFFSDIGKEQLLILDLLQILDNDGVTRPDSAG